MVRMKTGAGEMTKDMSVEKIIMKKEMLADKIIMLMKARTRRPC